MNSPFVTVLMPVYNAASYLQEAIDSILQQSFTDFEFLIINDGSSDTSEALILSCADKRIRYIKNAANLGLVATLNKGLELAQGKYIARMDADDISLRERLKKQIHWMEEHPEIGVCACRQATIGTLFTKRSSKWTNHHDLCCLLLFNSPISHPTVVFRREVLIKNNIRYSIKHPEDYVIWIDLISRTKFSVLPEVLFKYRIHKRQFTRVQHINQYTGAALLRLKMLQHLSLNFSDSEIALHNKIGSNQKIESMEELDTVEKWFFKLIALNEQVDYYNQAALDRVLGKMWLDTCGNTSIGVPAFARFFASRLSKFYRYSFLDVLKLLVKSVIR